MGFNPTAPEVTVVLDKERHLRLDFNAAARFEEVSGKNMFDKEVWANPNATITRALLWAMLVHEDAELTLEMVGGMLNFSNISELSKQMSKAYALNAPKSEGKQRPLV